MMLIFIFIDNSYSLVLVKTTYFPFLFPLRLFFGRAMIYYDATLKSTLIRFIAIFFSAIGCAIPGLTHKKSLQTR